MKAELTHDVRRALHQSQQILFLTSYVFKSVILIQSTYSYNNYRITLHPKTNALISPPKLNPTIQIKRRANQRQMTERLRRIPQLFATPRDLLTEHT